MLSVGHGECGWGVVRPTDSEFAACPLNMPYLSLKYNRKLFGSEISMPKIEDDTFTLRSQTGRQCPLNKNKNRSI